MGSVHAAVGLLLGGGLLVLSGCSSPVVDGADVEQQISAGLAAVVDGTFAVSCPAEIPAEAGNSFTCQVEDPAGGTTITVSVTQQDAEGAFRWRVASVSEG